MGVEQISPELVERMVALVRAVNAVEEKVVPGWFCDLWDQSQAIVAELPKPVDPDLIAARRIADEHSTRCGIKRSEPYANGRWDDHAVAAILEGIKLGRNAARGDA